MPAGLGNVKSTPLHLKAQNGRCRIGWELAPMIAASRYALALGAQGAQPASSCSQTGTRSLAYLGTTWPRNTPHFGVLMVSVRQHMRQALGRRRLHSRRGGEQHCVCVHALDGECLRQLPAMLGL